MNKKNEIYTELQMKELQDLNGGSLGILAGIVIAAVSQIILDWDNFKNGLMGRPEEKSQIIINF